MKIQVITIFTLLTLFSCTKNGNTKSEENQITINETPEILDDKKDFVLSSALKRGYKNDIIEELYSEATEKNINLDSLEERIEIFNEYKYDSLKKYNCYISVNNKYWHSAYNLIENLNDTIIGAELKHKIEKLEANYRNSISLLESEKEKIDSQQKLFHDKYDILKLMITLNMISNYQKNEKPKIGTLKNVNKASKTIIKEVERNISE